jgi:hypothetical protein
MVEGILGLQEGDKVILNDKYIKGGYAIGCNREVSQKVQNTQFKPRDDSQLQVIAINLQAILSR